jgi:hypothetical protein
VPPELDDVIMKALAREPEDRFQSAGEMQEALQRFLASQRPPFGTSKLAAWMKTAFASEMQNEKARLDSYGPIGRPSVLGGGKRTPSSQRAAPGPAAAAEPAKRGPTDQPAPPAQNQAVPRPGDQAPDHRSSGPVPRPSHLETGKLRPDQEPASLFDEDEEDLQGDSTVVTGSPFEEAETMSASELEDDVSELEDDVAEEPTTVFFASEEIEPIDEPTTEDGEDAPTRDLREAMRHAEAQAGSARAHSRPPAPPPPVNVPSAPPAPQKRPGSFPAPPQPVEPSTEEASQGVAGAATAAPIAPAVTDATAELGTAREADRSTGAGRIALVIGLLALVGAFAFGVWATFGGEEAGRVQLTTKPSAKARVFVDGRELGRAPWEHEVAPGTHEIKVVAEGFQPETRTVEVTEGAQTILEIALSPAPSEARAGSPESVEEDRSELVASDTEPGADEAAAGATEQEDSQREASAAAESQAAADEEAEREARQAEELRQARRERQAQEQRQAEAAERRARQRRAARERRRRQAAAARQRRASESAGKAATGTLMINSFPVSHVILDGRDTGKQTPYRSTVPAGKHRIGLRTSDGTVHGPFTVTVEKGETARFGQQL